MDVDQAQIFKTFQDKEHLAKIEADLIHKIKNNIDDKEITPKHKETRRDIREKRKHQAWIDKVSEASGMDFEQTAKGDLGKDEMSEAMIQIQSDLRPSTKP